MADIALGTMTGSLLLAEGHLNRQRFGATVGLLAASANCSASAPINRMDTILLLASPLGSFGLPGLRFLWLTACVVARELPALR